MTVTSKNNFKSSVNVKFDIGKDEIINRYLPTPSHAESLLGLLTGFNNSMNKHSHIIIGPYGTGKSMLGTIVGGIVSNTIDEDTFLFLQNKFKNVDDQIFNELTEVNKGDKKYLPVILNGNEGGFRQAIISAIMRTIKENDLEIVVPGIVSKIFETIELWEKEFPKTYRAFKKLLKEDNKELEVWKVNILNQDKKEIAWFKEIFPILTSGAQFVVEYNEDFIEQVRHVLIELDRLDMGLFVVYDEFGRFLQSLNMNEIHRTMQDLQDIAELSDDFSGSLNLLFITHKNLRQYFLRFSDEYQNEFQRIEKRFRTYHINSDENTFVRIAEKVLEDFRNSSINAERLDYMKTMLRKYPMFKNLNQVEVEELVLKGNYPMHPVTLYLLPILSNIFAQNERTLFTFLESSGNGGLLQHINLSNDFYFPHQLFDYFFHSLEVNEFSEEFSPVIKLYKRLLAKLPQLNDDTVNILKLITLWKLAGLQSKFKLTTEFLSFALDISEEEITTTLDLLSSSKGIRYNRILGYWELHEGSSLDLDKVIEEKIEVSSSNRKHNVTILEKHLKKRFYLANTYNDDKSMTRFASVNFVLSGEVITGDFDSTRVREDKNSDALVNYILLEETDHYEEVYKIIKNSNDPHSFFCLMDTSYDNIDHSLKAYKVIKGLQDDEEFLKQDSNIIEELKVKEEDVSFEISRFLNQFLTFQDSLKWFNQNQEITISNEIVLEKKLSDLMYKIYPDTPEVRNDSFNRRKINSVQLKAGYKVIDHVINDYDKPLIGIEGNGPDYLIFATIIKNNGINVSNLDDINSVIMDEIRQKLLSFVQQNPVGKLKDIVKILEEAPYGIRKPVIPILLITLLRDKWDNLMFFRNDMFVSGIDGQAFFTMVDDAEEYEYHFYHFDNKYSEFFNDVESLFGQYVSDQVRNKPRPIQLSSALLGWLRSLPRYTQTSNEMEENTLYFKDKVRQSEINPQQFIEELYQSYSNNLEGLRAQKRNLEGFLTKQKETILIEIFVKLDYDDIAKLKEWASNQPSIAQKNNILVKNLLKADYETFVEDLGYNIVGVPIEQWSDTTFNMFFDHINKELNNLYQAETPGNYITLGVNGKEIAINKKELSTKSKTIYNNVHRMIKNGGRTVPKDEIEYLLYTLIEEFID